MSNSDKPSSTEQKQATSASANGGNFLGRTARRIGRTLTGLSARPVAHAKPGAAAGIELQDLAKMKSTADPVRVTVIDYSPEKVQTQVVQDFEDFIIQHRPEWSAVRWINIDGLTNMDIIRALAEKYDLHPLAIEDTLHIPQRPKTESYPTRGEVHGRLFVVARQIQMIDKHLDGEQISIFVGRKTVMTFQERPPISSQEEASGKKGDVFGPLRTRLQSSGSRVRNNDASFLLYSLLDSIIDQLFPILEHYSDRLEEIEDEVLSRPTPRTIQQIHEVKRELLLLRRAVWPTREVISTLTREQHECLSETTRTYFRDVYDHCVQIIDMVETYREFASGLTETYMTALSNKMNEVMKVLTIITTIFVPLTFLAGVYGMNMKIPENEMEWTYPAFWGVCVALAVTMIVWFKRKRWI
jgi:magnesium transporter